MTIREKYKKLPLFVKFLINSLSLVVAWLLFFKYLKNLYFIDFYYEKGIYYLSVFQLKMADFFLKILGYQTEIIGKVIQIKGSHGVHLDKGCLGRNTLGLFVGFILVFPGKLKYKIPFIIFGTILFFFLNILRISILAIIDNCCRSALDFNHHFTFTLIIYGIIFILWAYWIKKYGLPYIKNS